MHLETPADARRFREFSANFFFWQGLRWVPLGAGVLLWGVSFTPAWPLPALTREWVPAIAMLGALLASAAIGRHYQQTYGSTETLRSVARRQGAVKWLVVYPAIVAALLVDGRLRSPILISGLVLAIALVLYVRATGGRRFHYLVAAIGLSGLSLLPSSG